jgi:hypothetical protein
LCSSAEILQRFRLAMLPPNEKPQIGMPLTRARNSILVESSRGFPPLTKLISPQFWPARVGPSYGHFQVHPKCPLGAG